MRAASHHLCDVHSPASVTELNSDIIVWHRQHFILFSVLTGYLLYYYFQCIQLESLCPGACGYDDFVLLVGGFAKFFERIKPLVLSIYRGL